jgi:hypothetical protein
MTHNQIQEFIDEADRYSDVQICQEDDDFMEKRKKRRVDNKFVERIKINKLIVNLLKILILNNLII